MRTFRSFDSAYRRINSRLAALFTIHYLISNQATPVPRRPLRHTTTAEPRLLLFLSLALFVHHTIRFPRI